jgi:glutamine synthetase
MHSVILEYIWLDGRGELRSKYKTVYVDDVRDLQLEKWNYDGSSTYQAETGNSEIILNPVNSYRNPFFQNRNAYLVMCDTYRMVGAKMVPTESNHRYEANPLFEKKLELDPWFGIEQEYFMMTSDGTRTSHTPLHFSVPIIPDKQGPYYCGVGNQHIQFRSLAEKHYLYCLYAGLKISGINSEVAPSQWEYQIGPVSGIEAGDQLWVSRYILHKISEEYNINISFKPKPLPSPWNGSGLHTNFSTTETREKGGLERMKDYIYKLEIKHKDHIEIYGDNSERLSGECETSNIHSFSCGYGNRGCSIRIPTAALEAGCGYFEDRRPASDADPYYVIGALFDTCCL